MFNPSRYRTSFGHALSLIAVLTSPVSSYLLDLRLAQVLGSQPWLGYFRLLQLLQITVVIATMGTIPQILVPHVIGSSGSLHWKTITRLYTGLIITIGTCFSVVLIRTAWITQALAGEPTPSDQLVLGTRLFSLSVLLLLVAGVNCSIIVAAGVEWPLYLISTSPTLAAVSCIQRFGVHTTLIHISAFTLAGTATLLVATGLILLRLYAKRNLEYSAEQQASGETLFVFGNIQQVVTLFVTAGCSVLLNRSLIQDAPRSVSDYAFAFRIVSVSMLPCVVYSNRLLRSLTLDQRAGSAHWSSLVRHASRLGYIYAYAVTTTILLARNEIPHLIFFKGSFTHEQYEQMGTALWTFALGLPAVSQVYVLTRVYAVAGRNEVTLLGSAGVTILSWIVLASTNIRGVYQIAALWAIGISLQCVYMLGESYAIGTSSAPATGLSNARLWMRLTTAITVCALLVLATHGKVLILLIALNIIIFANFVHTTKLGRRNAVLS